MSLIQLAIAIVIIIAIIAIIAWYLRKNNMSIPEPVMIGLYAILAIVMILFVANLAGMGPPLIR